MPAVFAGTLAATAVLGPNWTASAAEECIEKPNLEVNQPGHWYYYVDRVRHRRCWFFETSRAASSAPSAPDRAPASNADSQPSWFSRLATGVAQTLHSEPQQNASQQSSAFDNPATETTTSSLKYRQANKIARRERSQIVLPPATNGVASAARPDQSLPQPIAEKDEERPQLTAADRETLFKEFLKWYMDRNIFGRPSD
jgi:hypothetical protein